MIDTRLVIEFWGRITCWLDHYIWGL